MALLLDLSALGGAASGGCRPTGGDRRVVGEDADDTGAPFDLLVDPLQQVGAPDLAPVGLREVAEGQHVFPGLVHERGGIGEAFGQRGGQIIPAVEDIRSGFLGEHRA